MRRIFLARHGNRQDFVDPSWPDSAEEPYDPPLSQDGIQQARRLGQRLAQEGIEVIVTSPFLRTIQTAHYANEALGVPMVLEPGFGEWLEASTFERLPRLQALEILRAQYPLLGTGYVATCELEHPESAEQLCARVQRALAALLGKFAGTALVIGHAASVAAMGLIDERIERIECPLCALFCLEYDGARWRLSLNSDTSHLEGRLAPFTFPLM